ncbi:MaoC like domain-containing protein [Microbacterium sp. HM58-2]|nr:MaoC like domain-containing protein [Microbacterium sp. HM58-2]
MNSAFDQSGSTITVSVGDALPTVAHHPDERQLLLFCAATWNSHRIHYDRDRARAEGHRDLVVQGTLQGAWLADLVTSWASSVGGTVRRFGFRNVGTAYVQDELTATGRVTAAAEATDGGFEVQCALQMTGPDGVTAQGTATIVLPARHSSPN